MLFVWLTDGSPWRPLFAALIFAGLVVWGVTALLNLERRRRERWDRSAVRQEAEQTSGGLVTLVVLILSITGQDAELPWDAANRVLHGRAGSEPVDIVLGSVGQGCCDLRAGARVEISVRPCVEGCYSQSPEYGLHAVSFRLVA